MPSITSFDLFTIKMDKSGKVNVIFNDNNLRNIYAKLRELGFGTTILNGKRIYFRRNENEIKGTIIDTFNHAYRKYVESEEFILSNQNIENFNQIQERLIYSWPVKKSELLYECLNEQFTEKDLHLYNMTNDYKYRHLYKINLLLEKLEEWGFKKATESIEVFSGKGDTLFYKGVGNDVYVVLNHWNSKSKYNDGFDCWLSTYSTEKDFGKKIYLTNQQIRRDFEIERDFHLIQTHLGLEKI